MCIRDRPILPVKLLGILEPERLPFLSSVNSKDSETAAIALVLVKDPSASEVVPFDAILTTLKPSE